MEAAGTEQPWYPSYWRIPGSVARYLVKSLPSGLVGSFEADGEFVGLPRWCASWLQERRALIAQRAPEDLAGMACYLHLEVSPGADQGEGSPSADRWTMSVFAYGSYPACPEDWPEVPLGNLLEFAIADLEGKAS